MGVAAALEVTVATAASAQRWGGACGRRWCSRAAHAAGAGGEGASRARARAPQVRDASERREQWEGAVEEGGKRIGVAEWRGEAEGWPRKALGARLLVDQRWTMMLDPIQGWLGGSSQAKGAGRARDDGTNGVDG